ncbi:MAG TPA: ABC transporter ATP-binding protein [Clostridia bacterium]|nr:ABC transporter ATP-binding protein [Clostridia bacterium]
MLDVKNLVVSYGDVEVLHGVSLHVDEGEVVAIVGANAAGKTTLLSAISGILPIKSGEITFKGRRIDKAPAHEIVELGIVQVPEGRLLFPFLTVKENLEMGSINRRARPNRSVSMGEVFELLPVLKERQNQLAGSLSGGEAQMCAIGRGLMAKPDLIMLDEPSLGLAPMIVKKCLDLVLDMKRRGMTVLLVEQNVKASLEIADRAYVLENGSIVMEGLARDLVADEGIRKAYLGI